MPSPLLLPSASPNCLFNLLLVHAKPSPTSVCKVPLISNLRQIVARGVTTVIAATGSKSPRVRRLHQRDGFLQLPMCRAPEMRYLLCNQHQFKFHIWDCLELLGLLILTTWSLMSLFLHCSMPEIYSEKLVHLPHYYFVNDYKQVRLDVLDPKCQHKRSDYGLLESKFIFACFNQLYKMDPEIFNTW
ncbi:hypothetical protein K1719_039707 [Acacia pycnantha]|nr:hypothetical protein K1719_039707 [Acacia pycnantha]